MAPRLALQRVVRADANDIVIGAAAGVVATVPMSLTMEGLHRILPGEHRGALPPREVTEGLYGQLPAAARPGTEEGVRQTTLLLHYAYGGAAGALFTLMAPSRLPAAVGAGVLYGLAVWSGSYLGLLPALGIRHHARHDPPARSAMMIAAHVVWGATLGLVLRGRPGLRAASANPDSPQSGRTHQVGSLRRTRALIASQTPGGRDGAMRRLRKRVR